MNFKVIGLTRPGFEPMRFGFPNLPKWETSALLIRPSRLVDTNLCIAYLLYIVLIIHGVHCVYIIYGIYGICGIYTSQYIYYAQQLVISLCIHIVYMLCIYYYTLRYVLRNNVPHIRYIQCTVCPLYLLYILHALYIPYIVLIISIYWICYMYILHILICTACNNICTVL